MIKRIAFKMKLKPGYRDEYERRHNAIWPELKELLKASGIEDYSIFFDTETDVLFAVQKVRSEHGSQQLGGNAVVQKWWAYMADIMETNADNSPVTVLLDEVFYQP